MKLVLTLYILIYFQLVIHEFGHCIAAKINKWEIVGICLGDKDVGIDWRSLHISPYPISGHVDVIFDNELNSMLKKIFFFGSGILANITALTVMVLLFGSHETTVMVFVITIVAIFVNLMPKPFETDLTLFIKSIKQRQ